LSEGFIRTFGFTPDDVPSMDIWWQKAYSEKTQRDSISGAWFHAAATKEVTDEIIQTFETKVTTKDGSSLEKELRFVPIYDMVVMIFQDMRERKLPETQVPTSRNHESIETLAAGIAHDFNNLLLVILGNISLAKTNLTHEDWAFDRLIDAERASMMTKDLIQQLITFSKGGELSKRAMVITPLIMEVTHSTLSRTNIKGKYIMADDLYPVEIDEGQIRQVMHIILGNAREAMPQGGTVTISFENVRITREDYLPLNDGDYVKISLQDEGLGIKQEHLERIFDPYFTTKDVGSQKGVGLGLAIAYSIIKKHSGHIAVESTVGGGTTFHIYLPAYGKEVVTDSEVVEVHDEILKKKGKILVMDDAKAVRDVTGAMLGYIGYDVEFARDGREAIALYREAKQSDEPFDAVILDFTVQGGMGGKEAIQLLLAVDPHIRAIISSGYSGDPIMSEYQAYGFKTAILKPYKMEELEEILERLIREPD
jgi:signal transduction histidine kinase/CheY-like chemotaxis protein